MNLKNCFLFLGALIILPAQLQAEAKSFIIAMSADEVRKFHYQLVSPIKDAIVQLHKDLAQSIFFDRALLQELKQYQQDRHLQLYILIVDSFGNTQIEQRHILSEQGIKYMVKVSDMLNNGNKAAYIQFLISPIENFNALQSFVQSHQLLVGNYIVLQEHEWKKVAAGSKQNIYISKHMEKKYAPHVQKNLKN